MTGPVNQIDDMPDKAKVKQRRMHQGHTSGLYCIKQSMIQFIKDANNEATMQSWMYISELDSRMTSMKGQTENMSNYDCNS